jgi:hypothetical protein
MANKHDIVVYITNEMEAKFETWLDDAIDCDVDGRPITRRDQINMGPAPDLCRGWARIAFIAGNQFDTRAQAKTPEQIGKEIDEALSKHYGNKQ